MEVGMGVAIPAGTPVGMPVAVMLEVEYIMLAIITRVVVLELG